MITIENNLEIIGSDEQIMKVRKYISGDDSYIDFNKIIEMPEELADSDCDSLGGFVHSLLFGYVPGFDYEEDDDYGIEDSEAKKFDYQKNLQNKFKKLSDSQKRESLGKALKYQSNLERYGGLDNYHWCIRNWGTPFNASTQWLFSYNKIGFLTDEYSAQKLIIKLSQIFPQVVFNLDVIDTECQLNTKMGEGYYITSYSICNGEYTYCFSNCYGDKRSYNTDYYDKINLKINQYRTNYKWEYSRDFVY